MDSILLIGKKILAVEDNAINQMLVRHALTKVGAIVDVANHGTHALEFLSKSTYDIILMDIYMPELDGYQTTQIIRSELNLQTPIIAMTALTVNGEAEKCYSIGMNGYVAKPFTSDSLCNEIVRVIKRPTVYPKKQQINLLLSDGSVNVDLSFLNNLAGSDLSYIKTMIHLFIENTPNSLILIKESFAEGRMEHFQKNLHNLKSSLSVVKVKEMYDIVLQLEEQSKQVTDEKVISGLLNKLNYQFLKAENLLQKQLQDLLSVKQVA